MQASLQDCLNKLAKLRSATMTETINYFPASPFRDDALAYSLIQPSHSGYKLTPLAEIIFDPINQQELNDAFKKSFTMAALSPPILRELTSRYCLGLSTPHLSPMKKFLRGKEYDEATATRLIAICIANFQFANDLSIKLVSIE